MIRRRFVLALVGFVALGAGTAAAVEPLPSWNDSAARRAIVGFVARVTAEGSPDFVAPAERVAVFDNDGTLWGEQPIYAQLQFAIDRVAALAPLHPEWKEREPFASLLKGDVAAALAGGEKAIVEIVLATHTGMTSDEFATAARSWLETARHPKTGRLYPEMVYQPMLELLAYLRANGFRTFIVSGGGAEMIRVFSESVYGIPPEQVVGSTIGLEFEMRAGTPVLVRRPAVDFLNDKAAKPVAIQRQIGRRPIAAFGNSDGDMAMLQWTTAAPGARLGVLLHHTDGEREWAYDRKSSVGRLDKALDLAPASGWAVVDMKSDWATVYPAAKP